jgi:hypothetical protein
MSFKELYEYCQTLTPKISTTSLRQKVQQITSAKEVKVVKTSLDTTKIRGYFLSSEDVKSRLVEQVGGNNVIVLARGMNDCWDRFIITKELMHIFDSSSEQTSSEEEFSALLSFLETQKPSEKSPQCESDVRSVWMALACLCPEKHRREYLADLRKGHIDAYGIALKLKIPERQVHNLMSDRYSAIIDNILSAK